MRKRIIFDHNGLSTAIYCDASSRREGPDIYEVPVSPSGAYRKLEDGTVEPVSLGEWEELTLGYQQKRRKSYPTVGDQLDAILKYIQSRGDAPKGSPIEKILTEWEAVKNKYPKE